jgi:hypothetical protein
LKDWKEEYEKLRDTHHYALQKLDKQADRIVELEKQLEPNLFWNDNDPEFSYYSISDVVLEEYQNAFDIELGQEIEIHRAIRLPNVTVRITKLSDDGDIDWEIV